MNELKYIINKLIEPLCDVYFGKAKDSPDYPYAVFMLSSEADFDKDDYILEVDVYDKRNTAFEIDELSEKIIKKLDRHKEYKENIQTCIYRIGMLDLSNLETIRRRQLRFICKTYKGEIV